jgi:hypothetical protein
MFAKYRGIVCGIIAATLFVGIASLGWQEENVGKIIRRYVGRTAATKAIILQLNKRAE